MIELTQAPESLFWYWISERHAVYLRRKEGLPKHWTQDWILQQYKFTNPFRQNDRGTVWLTENFIAPHYTDDPALLAFNICWYRMFNWWGTGERLGWQTDWDTAKVIKILGDALICGHQVFTGAHIVYSPPGPSKIVAITDVCADLYTMCKSKASYWQESKELQETFNDLRMIYCVGGFMAYEMVSDMRHTPLLNTATDIMTWANPGPGCKRGLQRLGMLWKRDEDAIESMKDLLRHSWNERGLVNCSLPLDFPNLEMRDIEHSLCEFDKYCRVKFGEGKPRSKFNGVA
jgi:hypothetical protein